MIMKISTVRLAILLGVALAVGGACGTQVDTYRQDGAYGVYAGSVGAEYADGAIAVWACPDSGWAEQLGCPVNMVPGTIRRAAEDTRDGGVLTDAMREQLAVEAPTIGPDTCRWHPASDQAIVITCDAGIYLEWS